MSHKGEPVFFTGDIVVYPRNGVGCIEKIETLQFQDESYDALSIVLKATGVTISLPLDQAYEMGLRHVSKSDNIDVIFRLFSEDISNQELLLSKSWKDRKKILEDLFALGDLESLVEIVKYLYGKNQEKILPNSERRIYDFSLKFLIHELAESKKILDEEAEHQIAEALINNAHLEKLKGL